MSSVSNLSAAASTALPQVTLQSRAHKRGSQVESADDSMSSDASADGPTGTAQNLFGTLMQSLEQVIGLQPSTSTPAATASATGAASNASSTTSAAAATASTTASAAAGKCSTHRPSTQLQNYLNNLSQKLQANGTQVPTLTGSGVSTSA
jgi:hypothetical protein